MKGAEAQEKTLLCMLGSVLKLLDLYTLSGQAWVHMYH